MQGNIVAYDEGHTVKLADKLLLKDVISDLPAVSIDVFSKFWLKLGTVCLEYFLTSYVFVLGCQQWKKRRDYIWQRSHNAISKVHQIEKGW